MFDLDHAVAMILVAGVVIGIALSVVAYWGLWLLSHVTIGWV